MYISTHKKEDVLKTVLNSRILTMMLFLIYLSILSWIIIAKMDFSLLYKSNFSWMDNPRVLLHPGITWRAINIIPYKNGNFDITEVILNILFFIPFSFYVKMIFPNSSGLRAIILAFMLSLFYETIQYVLTIGFPDITDVIDNTVGAIIGVIIINSVSLIFREKLRIYMNFLLIIVTGYIIYDIFYLL